MPVLEGTKQNLLHPKYAPQNVKVWERKKNTAGTENRNGHRPSRMVRWSSLPTIPALSFPPPAFPQGLVEVRIKKFSSLPMVGFQPCSTWLTTVHHFLLSLFPLPFLLGTCLLPVFPTQCSQHTNRITPRAPLNRVLTELKKLAIEESRLLHRHHGGRLDRDWGKSKGDCHYHNFFQDSAQRKA